MLGFLKNIDPGLFFGFYQYFNSPSEEKLREYLDENLPPDAKEKYEIEIIKRNVEEMKKEIRENLKQEH
ncbi:hypothetical protein DT075_11130 [Bacillus licheniformis]|nr:hypothetical protein DT075_11130 [Bacillus licheniformis]